MHVNRLILQTKRLIILPLSKQQLLEYIQAEHVPNATLDVDLYKKRMLSALKKALRQLLLPAMAASDNHYLYYTSWTMINRDKNAMVGDICFKGTANDKGEIEIGYRTYANFRKCGYMTEALGVFIHCAFEQKGIAAVLAQTSKYNVASHKVLTANNFRHTSEDGEIMWWRINKNN